MMRKRVLLAVVATAALGLSIAPLTASASSHREAPLIAEDPLADNTDLYAFMAPDDVNPNGTSNRVVLVANYVPFENPAGGPNFYRFGDDVLYAIHVDNVGDAKSHIEFDFQFQTQTCNGNTFLYNTGVITATGGQAACGSTARYANWNRPQTYSVTMVNNGVATTLGSGLLTPPDMVGPKSTPNYHNLATAAINSLPGGIRVFAGQRDDPFFAELGGIFDLINTSLFAQGEDYLAGINVHSIVLSVPKEMLRGPNDSVIGTWATASRHKVTVLNGDGTKTESANLVQVSRLGNPLVNEVVIPLGQKDRFNATPVGVTDGQTNDAVFLNDVLFPELPKDLAALGIDPGAPISDAASGSNPRNDLVTVFLTGIPGLNKPTSGSAVPAEELRLNIDTPVSHPTNINAGSRFGLVGGDADAFPNGRRLIDDVVDIELTAADGLLCQADKGTPVPLAGALQGTSPCRAAGNDTPILQDGVNADTDNGNPSGPNYQQSFPYVADPHSP